MNSFGNYLYSLRRAKGMTQAELAELLGVTNKAVSKWETGEAFPETAQLVPLANIFGVTVDELLRGAPQKQAEEAPRESEENTVQSSGEEGSPRAGQADAESLAGKFRPESWNLKFALLIGSGVLVAAAGIVVLVIAASVVQNEKAVIWMTIAMMAAFIAAADIFTAAGILHTRWFIPVEDGQWKKRVRRFIAFMLAGITVAGGGVCCFIGVALCGEAEGNVGVAICVGAGLGLIAEAAFLFIYGGITWDAYFKRVRDAQAEKGDGCVLQFFTEEEREEYSLSGKLSSCIMLSAVAVFLALGFIWGLWHPGWIVFPIGGILCAIIETVFKDKKK